MWFHVLGKGPEPPEGFVERCPRCAEPLGEDVFLLEGVWVCGECFDEFAGEFTRRQLARELGVAVMDAEGLWQM